MDHAGNSGRRKTALSAVVSLVLLTAFIFGATLLAPREAEANPGKTSSCTSCHSTDDAGPSSIYVAVNGAQIDPASDTVVLPSGGGSFEVDYYYAGLWNSGETVSLQVALPAAWTIGGSTAHATVTGADFGAAWKSAWNNATGDAYYGPYDTSGEFANSPDGYSIYWFGSSGTWGAGKNAGAWDDGGGSDLDGAQDTMGTDLSITTGAVPDGLYEVVVMGLGHDTANGRAHVKATIMVQVGSGGGDGIAPTVTAFTIPAASGSLTVPVTEFTAGDAVGVTGYMVTESAVAPGSADAGWTGSAPADYTFAGAGAKTLYAWAKDAAGNVSTSLSGPVTVTISDLTDPVDGATFTATGGQDGQTPLFWDTATDDTAVDHYRVVYDTVGYPSATCSDGTEIYNALGVSTTHSPATNGVDYYYRVCAYDAAANVSAGLTATATPAAGCTANAATVQIDTAYNQQITADGGFVDYNITVFNNDTGGGCVAVDFTPAATDGNATDFAASSFGVSSLNIAPGGNASTTARVTAQAGAPRGAVNDASFKATAGGHADSAQSATRTTLVNVPGAPVSNYSVGDSAHFEFQSGTRFANNGAGALTVKSSAGVGVPGSPFTMVEVFDGGSWIYLSDWDTTGRAEDSYQTEILDSDNSPKAGSGLVLGNPTDTITFFADPNYSSAKDIFKDGDEVYVEVRLSGNESATTTSTLNDWYNTSTNTSDTVDLSGGATFRYRFTVDFATAGINDTDWGSIFWQGTDTGARLRRGIRRDESTPDITEPIVTAFVIPAADTVTLVPITTLTEWDDTAVTAWLLAEDDNLRPAAGDGRWTGVKPTDFSFSGAGVHSLHAWVKDAAGNVSLNKMSDSVTITPSDAVAPTVSAFAVAATSTSLAVSVTTFTAGDDTAVTGYKITESATAPGAGDAGWTGAAPATHTVSGDGVGITLYAWAKDAAGNISTSLADVVTVDSTAPVIGLTGAAPQTIEVGSAYSEPGATASDNLDGDLSGSIVIDSSAVNTGAVGSYGVTYDVFDSFGNAATQAVRTVDVVDTTAPVIGLTGSTPVTFEVGGTYSDAGATASDNYDGVITGSIVTVNNVNDAVTGSYTVTYDVADASGNSAAQSVRTVNVVDTTIPVIGLTGADPQTIEAGAAYSELGATATDNLDGVITGSIVIDAGAVNTSVVGSYSVTYDVADSSANNAVQKARTVDVVDTTAPVVTAFAIPATHNALTLSVATFTAGDAVGVAGYKVTESAIAPGSGDAGWTGSAPADYTFAGAGAKTLYAWAKDAAGNVSTSLSDTVIITLPDVAAPTVTAFAVPVTSTGQAVSVTDFTAGDDTAVTGYKVTESAVAPGSGDAGWTGAAPADFTVSGDGANITLYAWAKDAAGNVSTSLADVVTVDSTAPVISLTGADPQTVELLAAYGELGATASDNLDGDLSGSIVIDSAAVNNTLVGSYSVTYDVSDSLGNVAVQAARAVNVVDTTVPVITMLGSTPVEVTVNTSYSDAGATASDNYDGVITGAIVTVNNVNINLAGSYTVTYDVVDSSGNSAAQSVRDVNVNPEVCAGNPPAVAIAPAGGAIGIDGGMAVYTLTVTNNDSGGVCADRAIALTVTDTDSVANFFASTLESASVTVPPNGGTKSVKLWVTARAGAAASSNDTYATSEGVDSNTVTTDISIDSGGLQSRGSFVNASGDQFIISK